jgi:hypothetical protein
VPQVPLNWSGGDLWVGETGAERVRLPKGSKIDAPQRTKDAHPRTTPAKSITINQTFNQQPHQDMLTLARESSRQVAFGIKTA